MDWLTDAQIDRIARAIHDRTEAYSDWDDPIADIKHDIGDPEVRRRAAEDIRDQYRAYARIAAGEVWALLRRGELRHPGRVHPRREGATP